jgi:predicted anti-sigma-YlaC factor YlaD
MNDYKLRTLALIFVVIACVLGQSSTSTSLQESTGSTVSTASTGATTATSTSLDVGSTDQVVISNTEFTNETIGEVTDEGYAIHCENFFFFLALHT